MHPRASSFAAAAAVAISAIAANPTHAQCPTSNLSCFPNPGTTTAPQVSYLCTCSAGCGTGIVNFNLPAGTFGASGSGYIHSGGGSFTARDRYTLIGIPAGTPVSIIARLNINGSGSGGCGPAGASYGFGSATLAYNTTQVSQSVQSLPNGFGCSLSNSLSTALEIPIPVIAGQPFELAVSMGASGFSNGSGSMGGTLTFVGLPEGGLMTSCQGYSQSAPVAVNATSWGRLKQIYR